MKIFDAHTHIGSCQWKNHLHSSIFPTPEASLDELRSYGIERAITTPWQAVLCQCEQDLDEGNSEALELYRRHPSLLYPGVVVDFRWPARSHYWLELFRKEGLRWVGELVPKAEEGEHPFTAPAWKEILDDIAEHGMILQLHNTSGTAIVARAYPQLQVVGAHLNPLFLKELAGLPNVMVDISGLHGGLCTHMLDKARSLFGASRMLFGTDFEGYDPRCFIARAQWTFPPEEQETLFHGNVERLLK